MKLRPGYKQTEVGVIPEEWNPKPLGAFVEINSGESPSKFRFERDGTPYFKVEQLNNDSKYLEETPYHFIGDQKVLCGSLIFPKRGASILLNKVRILKHDSFMDTNLMTLTPKPSLDNEYLYYVLTYIQLWRIADTTSIPQINNKHIRPLVIAVPRIEEQRTIAAALSDVDSLIKGLDQLIAKKRDIKQAAMQQLLIGKQRLPGFTGVWSPINMAEKSELKARIGWQGLTTAEYLDTGEYYLVTGTDFINGKVNWSSCCFVDFSRYIQDKNIQLAENDILITKDGTIGKVGFVDTLPRPATLNSGVFVIRPKKQSYEPLFLFYVLTSRIFEDFLARLQAGSTISHLYQKDFINFSFLAPKLEEQIAIATVLSDMDAEITVLEQKREKTRALKHGMMQELLTGRIRLI